MKKTNLFKSRDAVMTPAADGSSMPDGMDDVLTDEDAGTEAAADVDISYDVPLIPQPDKLSCWAGSMAMLVSYARQQSISPETLAEEVGRSLRTSYGWDMLEAVKDQFGFQDIPLPSNASLYVSPQQWADWLRVSGPLWVTVVGAPSHAIVVKGIKGDLTPGNTDIEILNPWDLHTAFDADVVDFHPANNGLSYSQKFGDFTADFGNLELDNYGDWRVLYLPATASLSGGSPGNDAGGK